MVDVESSDQSRLGRLFHPGPQPWHVRLAARSFCRLLVRSLLLAAAVFKWLRGKGRTRRADRPARIVVTGTFFADSWVEAHIRPLAEAARCEHVWVVSDRPFVPITNATYVCPPRWLQRIIGRVTARSLFFVCAAVRHRAAVVGGFHLLINGLLALMVARLIGARAMWFCVGGWAEFVNGGVHGGNHIFNKIAQEDAPLEHLLLSAIRQFDFIATMGSGARDYLQQFGVTAPIEVMSGGMDGKLYVGKDGQRQYDLITVSRIVPVKRLDVFLKVVHRVSQDIPTVKAAVLGDGEELENLVRQSEALGISRNVSFVGRRTDVHRWLADARLFVLTSDSEGLALSLMEAMTAGLPAVVSDVGDLGDLVESGVNGWLVPPGEVAEFADRITSLLTEKQLYNQFTDAARRAAATYAVENMRARWDQTLERWQFCEAPPFVPSSVVGRRVLRSRRQLWESTRKITKWPSTRLLAIVRPRFWLGARFRRNLTAVMRSERWTREKTTAHQLHMLQSMVSLAYERSPFYRRLYRECGFEPGDLRSVEDMSRLPTTEARTIREHLQSMCSAQRPNRRWDYLSTGGTNGRPLHFLIDADRSEAEYAFLVAGWQRIGYTLSTPLAVFRGRAVHEDGNGLRREYDPVLRHHCYDVFHLTDENMRRYLDHVRGIGPCFLHVYPSSVAALARFVRRSGMEVPGNIRGIIAESEIVYPDQRAMVEEVFGCRYFSCYGHSEKVVAAAECEHSTDYHVWPTYGHFELLDADGQPVVTPGQRGEIVGTGFINRVVPFIRYRTGDFATYVGDHCQECGRQQILIRDIRGHRTQEVLVAADGSEICWAALNTHDDAYLRVRQLRFRQTVPGRATLLVTPVAEFSESDAQRILASLRDKLDGRIDVDIQVVDELRLTPTGKAIYVDKCMTTSAASEAIVD